MEDTVDRGGIPNLFCHLRPISRHSGLAPESPEAKVAKTATGALQRNVYPSG
jgi:hypothetical protein